MVQRIEALQALARDMVGDGKTPDLFFVTDRGAVVTVTTDFELASSHWEALSRQRPMMECVLEGRRYGVIASVDSGFNRLSEASKGYGEFDLYFGDDGRLYGM